MQQEIFKDIPEYEGMYQVSNLGNVKSIKFEKKIIISQTILNSGYYSMSTSKNGIVNTKLVHILMAITFLNHVPNGNKLVVDHINNIKTDNRIENLQIITHRKNSSKDLKNGTSKYIGVYFRKNRKRWISEIRIDGIKKYLGSFVNEIDASIAYKTALNELQNIEIQNTS